MHNQQPQQHKKQQILAIIPARGGSKRLPQKNSLPLANKPLFVYSIEAALKCPLVNHTIVTSDDTNICQIASQHAVEIIRRPAALAQDTVSNEHVVQHAILEHVKKNDMPDYIVLLQPTSPLRTATHLTECLENFLQSTMKSTMSVCVVNHHPGKYTRIVDGGLTPYTCLEDVEKRTQELEPVYRQNGAIYALATQDFLQQLKFYQTPCLPYIMSVEESIDIDSRLDLFSAEFLLTQKMEQMLTGQSQ